MFEVARNIIISIAILLLFQWCLTGREGSGATDAKAPLFHYQYQLEIRRRLGFEEDGTLSGKQLMRALVYLFLALVVSYLILPSGGCNHYADHDDNEETIPDLL